MIGPNNKIVIIGTLPPPIGGVSIYNQRLYDHVQQDKSITADFADYKRSTLGQIIRTVRRHDVVYLNCSSPAFKFFMAALCRMLGRRLLVTHHGNLPRHAGAGNLLDKLTLRLSTLTIVLNRQSYDYASRYSSKVFAGTAFIPPLRREDLSPDINTFLARCRKDYRLICSSNAHNVSFDSSGKEIYQVRFLLRIFAQMPDFCLVLSDPSGQYYDHLKKNRVEIPANVYVVKETHSYFELLKQTDVMLRITTTDGDSISVREALYLGKPVIASGVVDRPAGVITVPISEEAIIARLKDVAEGRIHAPVTVTENGGEQVVNLLRSL